MTIADTVLLTRIRLAAKTDAELGLSERDMQIERLLGSEGRVDPTARDHDRLLVQRSLPGMRTELQEDVARVDEALAGRSSRGANVAIVVAAAVEALAWLQVAGMLGLPGISRVLVAAGLTGTFLEFSRRIVRGATAPTASKTSTRTPSLLVRLRTFLAAVGTRAVYALVVLCVVVLKVSDAVEDAEPLIRVLPQALLLAAACVGPALLIESLFAKSAEVRELESKKRGFSKRLGTENARIRPAQREIDRRHREVAHHEALIPRLRAAYDLEHARVTARKRLDATN